MKFNRIGIAKRLILAKKFREAKKLLTPLARKNSAMAQLLLGYLYYGGDLNTTSKQSQYWLERSARNGNPEALTMLANTDFKAGLCASEPQTPKRLLMLQKAAKRGSAEAQRSLACAYAHGQVVQESIEKTMYWDRKAAERGLAESQNDLALMLLYPKSGKAEIEEAISRYERSASKDVNVPYAQWAAEALARIYCGEPDENFRNESKKIYWESRAKSLSGLPFRSHPDWFYENT